MKKIFYLLTMVSLAFVSCDGDPGPPGPPGQDGGLIVADAFEIEVDFTEANNFEIVEPYGFEVFPYDVVLTYILWEVDGTEIWRLIPQDVFFNDGVLTYNFDFTQEDVRIFLDGTIDLNSLGSEWTQNQVFRVVVVPADNVDASIDFSNYNNVIQALNIEDVRKLN
ncbi:hypothetical protein SAMN04487906_2934 [Zhouia amylolytica]|uniref:Dihydrolipoamide dehydrogenase n=2 Tax=Zhouia amylolytica TaxID=376730 RepID=W2URH1_9FLAO|nr:hypothetical protein [Zhouia amylolytica]ETN96549.1 hypothetical protein P278_06270 [Zhouia amylolytica AD3]MCQ0109964.1 hypothetical protein [Zhouia amylolytica]SFT09805.1 hypothetical protein SAMN04487906_2934 [Zhouia amylolytica]